MKQIYLFKRLFASFVLLLMTTLSWAYDAYIDGIYYNLSPKYKTAEVTRQGEYSYYMGSVVIPSSITYEGIDYSVTSIGEKAFGGCYSLMSVKIPETVNIIGRSAFYGDYQLTSVNIPEGVTRIEEYTFYGCSNLKSIILPNSLKYVSGYSFQKCSSLTSITIPSDVEWFSAAFMECPALTSVTINSNKITSNPNQSGTNNIRGIFGTQVKTYIMGGGVTTISKNAFYNSSKLISITIPENVTSIGSLAIGKCPQLTNVYCYATEVPSTASDAFDNSNIAYTTLYVPEPSLDNYKNSLPWKNFGEIKPITGENKCGMPIIKYTNGNLTFESITEDVKYISRITDSDMGTYSSKDVILNVTYNISVYAIKDGYINSDVATAILCWIDASPEGEGFVNGVAELEARPVLLQTRGNIIDITGVKEGEDIKVYGVGGQLAGSAKAYNDGASVSTTLNSGSVAIVKIGEKSVKIVMK